MTALGRERRVRSGRERRRLATAFGCLALALGLLLTPPRAPGTLAASADGLVTRADATYTVRPADHLVQVAVDVAATNTQPDRSTSGGVIHYFFTQASFGVQPEATRVHASSGSRALAVTVRSQTGFRRVCSTRKRSDSASSTTFPAWLPGRGATFASCLHSCRSTRGRSATWAACASFFRRASCRTRVARRWWSRPTAPAG